MNALDKNFRLNSKNILVICGGMSNEHEISLLSAEYLIGALEKRHHVTVARISKSGEWRTSDGRRCFIIPDRKGGGFFVYKDGMLVKMPVDAALPVIHGQSGEDGAIQGLLELAGIPYVGCSISASAICYDKALTKAFAQGAGVRQAAYVCCMSSDLSENLDNFIAHVEGDIGYPCFVKPARSGSSVGISRAGDRAELTAALFTAGEHDRKILVEKAVFGRELECAVLGNDDPEASVIGEILPDDGYYDYDSKYHSDKDNTAIPDDLDEAVVREIRQAAVAVYKACGCSGLSRVDFFLEAATGHVVFNEINTFPGFTPISMYPRLWEASGVRIESLCDLLIHFALERQPVDGGAFM
jgi:D-alanine-D-alanine ligase